MREIVGVVADVKIQRSHLRMGAHGLCSAGADSDRPSHRRHSLLRRILSLARPLAETVRSIDSDLPTYNVKTVEEYLDGTIAIPRFNTLLLGIFAGLALVLTAIGLYGVISYSVAQRTHEIGIRMALGAQPGEMMRLVVGQGVRLALLGVGLGLIAAFAFTRFLSSLLFGVTATDPLSFAIVVVTLLAVVLRRVLRSRPTRDERRPDGGVEV